MTMPGLPKVPAAERIDVDDEGRITGLFLIVNVVKSKNPAAFVRLAGFFYYHACVVTRFYIRFTGF